MSEDNVNGTTSKAPVGQFHDDGRVRGSDSPAPGRCGKHLRRSDPPRYCMGWPMKGRTTCRIHSGTSRVGPASPHYKTGRYSKAIPRGLNEAYGRALEDQELLSLRDDIALLESRQVELLNQLSNSPLPPWQVLIQHALAVQSAQSDDERAQAVLRLVATAEAGQSVQSQQEAIWNQLRGTVNDKVRASRAEVKRLHDLNNLVTVEQALTLVRAVMTAVRERVQDRFLLASIQEDILSLVPAVKVIEVSRLENGDV